MEEKKRNVKKDRLFVIVIAIIVANLFYVLVQLIPYLVAGGWRNLSACALTVTNIVGITGALWLVREERKRRRNANKKTEATEEA